MNSCSSGRPRGGPTASIVTERAILREPSGPSGTSKRLSHSSIVPSTLGGGAHKYKTSAFLRPVVHRAIASRGTSARTVQAISARGWQASRPCHRRASSYDRFAPAPTTSPDVPRQTLTVFPMKSGSENVAYRNIAAKRWRVSAASFT